MRHLSALAPTLSGVLLLGACAIHHVTPYVPDALDAPQTADAIEADTNCFESGTAAEAAICANPGLAAPHRELVRALHVDLLAAGLFGRDAVLASQRVWLLALPDHCRLPAPPAKAGPDSIACLATAFAARAADLRALPVPPATGGDALAQYVALRPAAGARAQPDPTLCADLQQRAATALRRTSSLDPAGMGGEEVAGTHGPDSGSSGGLRVTVTLYDANAYALFQRRARSVSLDDRPVITPVSLTGLVEALMSGSADTNQGGRFSAFASQTGDYGSLDVFRLDGRLLAMAADPWGSTTPAAPGEAAHAGVWDLAGPRLAPVCLFDTYTRPAEPGAFDAASSLAQWRGLLAQLRDAATSTVGDAATRDQALLAADTDFVVLHMPLLAVQQAGGGWTPWLRRRHDLVLDGLFAWGHAGPANLAVFDRIVALLRPAATDLVHTYQTTQGLTASEATQAAGLAVMELLYQAMVTVAPGLGADLSAPGSAFATLPRYPILASPR